MKRRQRKLLSLAGRSIDVRQIEFFRSTLLRWWHHNQRSFPWRSQNASIYTRIVTELLLQRTRAETVAAFWPTFRAKFPHWAALSRATVKQIEGVLRPIGLSRQRAPRLRALAVLMTAAKGRFPPERSELEALPGVGQYVANAVLLFKFGEFQPLLDVNMARVLERFFGKRKLADIRHDPYLQELARTVVAHRRCRDLNWAILDLAAAICRSSYPCIERCPLAKKCNYARLRSPTARGSCVLRSTSARV